MYMCWSDAPVEAYVVTFVPQSLGSKNLSNVLF